ncbi:progesterone-induced-blocking factor 1-like [Dysidea avara]|uniref:progesterone-induced-blocking factor 1-like n=1 Tax=Dysidea avara TaxID=196820 RepID=UPI003328697D
MHNDTTEESTLLATEYSTFSSSFDTSRPRKVTQGELERKQLQHSLELVKLELNQKKLLIATMEREHVNKVEELEEQLCNISHEKRLLQVQLSSVTSGYQQELVRMQRETQEEIAAVKQRQEEIEASNPFLADTVRDIKNSLKAPLITIAKYEQLMSRGLDQLSLKDFILVGCYDQCQPHVKLANKLSQDLRNVETQLQVSEQQVTSTNKELQWLRTQYTSVQTERDSLADQLTEIRSRSTHDQHKVEHYDDLKRQLDITSQQLSSTSEQINELEMTVSCLQRDKDQLTASLSVIEQKITILAQDKDYLQRQVEHLNQSKLLSEQKIEQLNQQLSESRQNRESLYDKLVNVRETHRMGYESRLEQELQQFHSKTNLGMEQLRLQTREMFERENRSLQDAHDVAIIERDKAIASERDIDQQLQELKIQYHQLQVDHNSQVAELEGVIRVKCLELERTKVLYEEASQNLLHCETYREQQTKRIETLNADLLKIQGDSHMKETELVLKVKELTGRVDSYEKVENELDQVVLQAAEVCDDANSERVLSSYGIGVPSAAKRRLQQSVHLARRLMLAERSNVSLRQELVEERSRYEQLIIQVERSNTLLDQTKQPHNLLVNGIRSRDTQLDQLKTHNHKLQEEIRQLNEERSQLMMSHNKMSGDMERLLSQSEELATMKQSIRSLCTAQQLQNVKEGIGTGQPQPLLFTNTPLTTGVLH